MRIDEKREQHWLTYTVAMLLFHVGGFLIIYGLMRLQDKIRKENTVLRKQRVIPLGKSEPIIVGEGSRA